MTGGDLNQLLAVLATDRRKRRDSIKAPFTPIGEKGWRKRLRAAKKRKKEKEARDFLRKHTACKAKQRANRKYYEENKARLNEQRRLNARKPRGAFLRARKKARERGEEWELTFEEWKDLWFDENTKFRDPKDGFVKQAWKLRGSNYKTCTQMRRRDTDASWNRENCRIVFGKP